MPQEVATKLASMLTSKTTSRSEQALQREFWEKAGNYVVQYKYAICNKAKKFLNYASGLSQEDFFQESYLIAYEALKEIYRKNCIYCKKLRKDCNLKDCSFFKAVFWGKLRSKYAELADIPSDYKITKDKRASRTPYRKIEITEIINEENYQYSTVLATYDTAETIMIKNENEKEKNKIKREVTSKIFNKLTEKEKKLLTLLDKGETLETIAKKLDYKKINGVMVLLKRTTEKIKKIREQERENIRKNKIYQKSTCL